MQEQITIHSVLGASRAFLDHRRPRCVAGTLTAYRAHLDDWAAWRAERGHGRLLADVGLGELRAYMAQLGERCKETTTHNHFRTLRALWRWLAAERDEAGRALLRDDQRDYFANGRISLPPIPQRERPAVTADQVEQLLAGIGEAHDEQAARDRAIILLLWESGVRVFELAGLEMHALDLAERQARIIGKGDKEGFIFWGPRCHAALLRYLRLRRGSVSGSLFRGCSSRNNGGAMTTNAVRLMLKRRAEDAGVELPKGAVVHGFRHGCARELRRRGCSKEEVRDILRHEDLETTERYLGLDVEAPRSAHRRAFGGEGGVRAEGRKRG